jgi:alpha-N-arabinofuranosidase
VTAACQAQLVNVIAPIMTEPGGPAWRQTIFHPFAKTAALAKGDVLRLHIDAPAYETAKYGVAPLVDAVATHDPATGDVTVFAVNRDVDNPVGFDVDLSAFGTGLTVAESWTLTDDDVYAANTKDAPERVTLRPLTDVPGGAVAIDGGAVTLTLPRVSWTAIRFTR